MTTAGERSLIDAVTVFLPVDCVRKFPKRPLELLKDK